MTLQHAREPGETPVKEPRRQGGEPRLALSDQGFERIVQYLRMRRNEIIKWKQDRLSVSRLNAVLLRSREDFLGGGPPKTRTTNNDMSHTDNDKGRLTQKPLCFQPHRLFLGGGPRI